MSDAGQSPHAGDSADDRLKTRVLPAVMRVIERGDFSGSVMRKVAKESRMSLNTLYSIVPNKSALMLAVAVHLQSQAFATVFAQTALGDGAEEISRKALHASFEQFTRIPGLAASMVSIELDDPDFSGQVSDETGLVSAPGLAGPFQRDSAAWRSGRLRILTLGFLGTLLAYSRSLINVDEARETLDMLATAAYLLPEDGSAAHAG